MENINVDRFMAGARRLRPLWGLGAASVMEVFIGRGQRAMPWCVYGVKLACFCYVYALRTLISQKTAQPCATNIYQVFGHLGLLSRVIGSSILFIVLKDLMFSRGTCKLTQNT